jgi:hypothetical protein
MRYQSLRKRISELSKNVPQGYATYDSNGRPVIQSALRGLEWFAWATSLLRSKGCLTEKSELLWKLRVSVGPDNSGGNLYEFLCASVGGILSGDDLRILARMALEEHGYPHREAKRSVAFFLEGFLPKPIAAPKETR